MVEVSLELIRSLIEILYCFHIDNFVIVFFLPHIDEVGAVVFDIGASSARAGYAGEDVPKVCYCQLGLSIFPFLRHI